MGKLMPVLFLSGMSIMALISWQSVLDFNKEIDAEYNRYITKGEEFESKEIYIDAVKEYKKAFEMRPDYDTAIHMSDLYKKLGNYNSEKKMLESAIELDPSRNESYKLLIDSYTESNNNKKIYETLMLAKDNNALDDKMNNLLKDMLNSYNQKRVTYDEFHTWHYPSGSKTGNAVICEEGLYGVIDSEFEYVFKCKYDYIGLPSSEVVPVSLDGDLYYMDMKGNKKLVTDEPAEYLGSFSEKLAPAKINGKYGYLDMSMKEHNFEYDYAGGFLKGMAAVNKDGKWAVIDSSFKNITAFDFDEIVMDSYDYCSSEGVFFGKIGDKYSLYNKEGKKISDDFDEVKLFASKEPAAVRIGKKWGFVDVSGSLVIQPEFEDADSFNLGFAPIKSGGKWYFIDSEKEKIVELKDLKSVSSLSDNGYALAEDKDGDVFVSIRKYE